MRSEELSRPLRERARVAAGSGPRSIALLLASAALGAGCAGLGAGVDPERNPWGHGNVHVGGFLPSIDTTVAVGTEESGAGIDVNLEDALGLDTSDTVLRAGGSLRLGESRRHSFQLDYLGIDRKASKTLENDITIDGETYPAGTDVSTRSTIEVIRAGYSYSLFLDDRINLGLGFGLYAIPIELDFDGLAASDTSSFTAPLPTLGLSLDVALRDDLFLKQRLDLFYLEVGQFEGGMSDALLGIEWRPWEHVGIGLAYNRFLLTVEATDEDYPGVDFVGDLDYQYNGALLYLTYAF